MINVQKKDELDHCIGAYFLAVVDFRYNITIDGKKKKVIFGRDRHQSRESFLSISGAFF